MVDAAVVVWLIFLAALVRRQCLPIVVFFDINLNVF